MSLSEVAVRRPVFTVMVTAALVVLGLAGLSRLGTDLFPDVSIPIVTVSVVYPGASPEEVETLVAKPIEDSVATINGIDRVVSTASESLATVSVMFKIGVDIEEAATQMRERVTQTRALLPHEVKEPAISRLDASAMPVVVYSLHGPRPLSELRKFADDVIRRELQQVDGVGQVEIRGGQDREIQVLLDQVKLDALGIAPDVIVQLLKASGVTVPAGRLTQGTKELNVRTVSELATVDALRAVSIAVSEDGSTVKLGDIAQVVDGFTEARQLTRLNGADAVTFQVAKQSGRNTIAVADAVAERIAALSKDFPEDISATLIVDSSQFIRENAYEVEESIVFGGAMAILIILVFMLDLRSTVISALALPTSVIATFFVMYACDFTLNTMTLLALSLAIGLLIDDAVVVRENIFKHLERGKPPMQAAVDGTREIALAVLATTLTIVAVFVPVAFMEGLVGQFFKQFGLTISAAVLVSLFVAFTLDPMLSSRFSKPIDHTRADPFAWLKRPFQSFFSALDQAYRDVLDWSVHHKAVVLTLAVLALVGTGKVASVVGADFSPAQDRGQFNVSIELPSGTSLAESARLSHQASNEVRKDDAVTTVLETIGVANDANHVEWRVLTTPKSQRTESITAIQARVRAVVGAMPGAKAAVSEVQMIEGTGFQAPIMLNVRGESYATLEQIAAQVTSALHSIPGVVDVDTRYSPGKSELRVGIDRARAADHGLSVAQIAGALRIALEGDDSVKLRQGDDEVPVRVRLRPEDRTTPDDVLSVTLSSPKGVITLADVAHLERGTGPQRIERNDRLRQIVVSGAPDGRSLGDVAADLEKKLSNINLPAGYSIRYDGQLKQMMDTNDGAGSALLLGVIFIYLVLASQFESFIHPLTIMMTLPLALIGAIAGLFLSHNSMSIGAMIGIVLLMGLVTKNAILLVDRAIERVRDHDEAPLAAILAAGPERLRPILMTSAAIILGMLPTALSNADGSEFRAPMAISVIGGVISSTLLSLIVVPALYLTIESGKAGWARLFVRAKSRSNEALEN